MTNAFRLNDEAASMHPQVVRLAPPHLSEVDVFATDVQAWEVQDVPLAQPAEVATFATENDERST